VTGGHDCSFGLVDQSTTSTGPGRGSHRSSWDLREALRRRAPGGSCRLRTSPATRTPGLPTISPPSPDTSWLPSSWGAGSRSSALTAAAAELRAGGPGAPDFGAVDHVARLAPGGGASGWHRPHRSLASAVTAPRAGRPTRRGRGEHAEPGKEPLGVQESPQEIHPGGLPGLPQLVGIWSLIARVVPAQDPVRVSRTRIV